MMVVIVMMVVVGGRVEQVVGVVLGVQDVQTTSQAVDIRG